MKAGLISWTDLQGPLVFPCFRVILGLSLNMENMEGPKHQRRSCARAAFEQYLIQYIQWNS